MPKLTERLRRFKARRTSRRAEQHARQKERAKAGNDAVRREEKRGGGRHDAPW